VTRHGLRHSSTASPPPKAISTLVGKVSLSHFIAAFVRFSQTNRYDLFQAQIKVLRCNNAVKRDAYHAKTPEDYDRTNVRYIRRRRNRLVYRRLAKAAALLVIAALIVFACARSG
jgi:hypothetical protein